MQKKVCLLVSAVIIFATGCTLFDRQEKRINYTEVLDTNEFAPTLITDAKQRAIINMTADVRSDGNGDNVNKNHPKRIICTEPSPDVAQAISAAFTAAAQVDATLSNTQKVSGSGSLGSSYVSSIAQLGERLATVQLLRDKMYRACEAYQNGAISDTSYTLMLSRFDKTMASMLAWEFAAGAFGRGLAALGGSASTGNADPKKLASARDAIKAASDKVQEAAKQLAEAKSDDADKQKKEQALNEANTDLEKAVTALMGLEYQAAVTAAQSGSASGSALGQIVNHLTTTSADSIVQMNANYLDDDASSTIIDACIVALDRNRPSITKEKINEAKAEIEKIANSDEIKNKNINVGALKESLEQYSDSLTKNISPLPLLGNIFKLKETIENEKKKQTGDPESVKSLQNVQDSLSGLESQLKDEPSLTQFCKSLFNANLIQELHGQQIQLRSLRSENSTRQIEIGTKTELIKSCTESTKEIRNAIQKADKFRSCISALKF